MEIQTFDRHNATEREYAAWNRFGNRAMAESWPDDPPVPLDMTIRNLRSQVPFVEDRKWVVWNEDGSDMIARASADVWHTGTNEHAMGFHIMVLPEARRQGVGKRLLTRAVESARDWNRRLLLSGSINVVPAGEEFLRRIGAREALTSHLNQLDIREVDPELLTQWQERARERAPGFRLGFWEGPYPEESLEEVVRMKEAWNLMPRGDLEIEDEHRTPEQMRQSDQVMLERGDIRWTFYVRDPEKGEIAGYTEVWWHPDRPMFLGQDDTAVFPQYQNRGLGRWLKAAMLEKVLRERPEVRWVRTGNAMSNAPMLKINYELGFRPYRAHTEWQVEIEKVEEYLAGDLD